MEAAVGPDHTMLNLIPLAIPQRLLDDLVDAFAVIGMNRFNQIFEREMVVRRPAKVRFEGCGKGHLVGAIIQMPASQFGCFQSHFKPLLARPQLFFSAFALRDIYTNADQTQRLARMVEEDFPPPLDPVDAAVRPNYSPFGIVFAAYGAPPHDLFGVWPVFGVHAFQPSLIAAAEAAGRQAVYRLAPFRTDDLIGLDSPLEAAEPGRLLS